MYICTVEGQRGSERRIGDWLWRKCAGERSVFEPYLVHSDVVPRDDVEFEGGWLLIVVSIPVPTHDGRVS